MVYPQFCTFKAVPRSLRFDRLCNCGVMLHTEKSDVQGRIWRTKSSALDPGSKVLQAGRCLSDYVIRICLFACLQGQHRQDIPSQCLK